MRDRPDQAPGPADRFDPWIVRLDIFAARLDSVVVQIQDDRQVVGERQQVVQAERHLVVPDRDPQNRSGWKPSLELEGAGCSGRKAGSLFPAE
jgi:hypothetical protein